MANQSAQAATNERIVRLDDSKQRQERIARDLTRLLARK
jgi:hypothetical protein